jgi:Icc-related predicted phosphoesterase
MHRQVTIPEGDFLLHAGDLSNYGEPAILADLINWFAEQTQVKNKIFICGNHEIQVQDDPGLEDMIFRTKQAREANIHYLRDSGIVIDGINFYGSPWQPWFYDWAWNFPERDSRQDFQFANKIWNQIPDNTQVLITHGPPRGILDDLNTRDERVGCPVLRKRVGELKDLRLSVHGHLHRQLEQVKTETHDGVIFANVTTCDEQYRPINPPVIVDIDFNAPPKS